MQIRLLDALRDIVLVIRPDGRIADANETAVRMYGYSRDELLSLSIHDLRGPGFADSVAEHISKADSDGLLFETVHRKRDGSTFPVEVSSRGIDLPEGRVLVSIVRDISDRKRAELALERSEEKYRSLYRSMSEGVVLHEIVFDEGGTPVDYRLLDGNLAFEAITGLEMDQIRGKLASEVYGTSEAPYLDIYAEVAETGRPTYFETTFEPMQKSFSISVFSPGRGTFATVFQDITARTRVESEREQATAKIEEYARLAEERAGQLETAIQSMSDAVILCGRQGRVTLANEAALQLIGLKAVPEGELLVDHMDSLKLRFRDGTPLVRSRMAISRALEGETVRHLAEIAIHPVTGVEIDLLVSAAPIRSERGTVVGAVEVARDVTEVMELDRLKDQFINVAAHELKTPVTVMKGFSQLLLRHRSSVSGDQRKVLERIDRGADRINGIVQAILDVSALSSDQIALNPEKLDLAQFIATKVANFASSRPNRKFEVEVDGPVTVMADRDRIDQVAETLLDNAFRYSPAGGGIEVRVAAQGRMATVSVTDHGIGIPDRKRGRIFQRFYRAHSETEHDYGGLGVGLYIAREIVLRHDGKMWFESEDGKGSTFSFALPMS